MNCELYLDDELTSDESFGGATVESFGAVNLYLHDSE
jgi:hypothetical protein